MKRIGKNTKPSLRVGSRVKFDFAARQVVGTVIEDRGNIGVGGRRLLRVRLELTDGAEPLEFELPAEEVRVATRRRAA